MSVPSAPPPAVRLVSFFAGVALLTCGTIALYFGAYSLRGAFGNWYLPFALIALPLFALYALAERGQFRLSRLLGLPVRAGDSWLFSAAMFAVFGAAWFFVRASLANRDALKADAAVAKPVTNDPPPLRAPGRELVETVVFVVVLVSMLNVFVVQAFVIPTGSMAETLYGYNKVLTCPECGYTFAVNDSDEVDPQHGERPQHLLGYCCPNCRYENPTGADQAARKNWLSGKPDSESGDRVLVGKFLGVDDRGRVVVFKYPDAPQTTQTAQNYIKRLVGLPGETIAIHNGDLYVTRALTYPESAVRVDDKGEPVLGPDGKPKTLYPRPANPNDLWRAPFADRWPKTDLYDPQDWDYGYANTKAAVALFDASRAAQFALGGKGFEIYRKPDDLVLSERRIVYDNDHQSQNLVKAGKPSRWAADPDAGSGWAADTPKAPKVFTHSGDGLGWVRYQHLMSEGARDDSRPGWYGTAADVKLAPRKITNFQGYNAGHQEGNKTHLNDGDNWVGDLVVDCAAEFATADATLVLELGKGEWRYRAEFAGGRVTLKRYQTVVAEPRGAGTVISARPWPPAAADEQVLADAPTGIGGGKHAVRFANVDCRLRVWVDDKPVDFGGKGDYDPPGQPARYEEDDREHEGWTKANDIDRPVCVGAKGGVTVSGLKVWRDTFYTHSRESSINKRYTGGRNDVSTYYVQPGHYLCMGDNSAQSSDGRIWGLVPERLMLGRAVFIFFPFERIGFIK